MTVKRWLCTDCAPAKLIRADLKYGRSPGNDRQTRCSFCGSVRVCKCYNIEIGAKDNR